jgi:hypothetical protein
VTIPGWGELPLFDFVYRTEPAARAGNLPTTVVFGNSFSDMYFNLGLQSYFESFYRARNVMPRMNHSLADLPPGTKYVVYQFFAPFLGTDMADWDPSPLRAAR